jgi:hypothetical protein
MRIRSDKVVLVARHEMRLSSEVHPWEQPVDKVSRRSALLLRRALHHAAFVDFSGLGIGPRGDETELLE